MTVMPDSASATARHAVAQLRDLPENALHIEVRIDDPERQAKMRAAMERIQLQGR